MTDAQVCGTRNLGFAFYFAPYAYGYGYGYPGYYDYGGYYGGGNYRGGAFGTGVFGWRGLRGIDRRYDRRNPVTIQPY